jgi:peptidyl-prolyl cis-trans isomerase C
MRVAIEADRLVEIETNFAEQMGRRPEAAEIRRMIDAEVEEEILFREAVARGLLDRDSGVQTRLIQKMLFLDGRAKIDDAPALLARAIELDLHRDDIVVRRILVQKMKLLGSALGKSQFPTQIELQATYQKRQEALRAPDRLSLTHVFLSSDRRGSRTRSEAQDLRARLLTSQRPIAEAPSLGDPFPLGHRLEGRSQHDLERTFGARFGEEAVALDTEIWSDPIASAYGEHLLFIHRVDEGTVPPFGQVAERLRLEMEEVRRNENLEALVKELRTRYQVVLPTSAGSAQANRPQQETG